MSAHEDYGVVFLEVGMKGELTTERALRAATVILTFAATSPEAVIHVTLGGYDNDPRELWDIPEAAVWVKGLAEMLCAQGHALDDFNFADDSIAMLALCCGVGKIIERYETGYRVEIGTPP